MIYDNLDLIILKTITTNKNKALEFAFETDLTKQNFFTPETWNFANTIVNYIKNYKDLPTLKVITEKLKNKKHLADNIENIWKELDNVEVNDLEYIHNLEKIKKRFADKQIISAQLALSKIVEDSIDIPKAVAEMQKAIGSINSLNKNKTFEHKNIKDYLPTFVENFNHKKNNPGVEVGLKTYFNFFDAATNCALGAGDMVLIAASSGHGKSLLLNCFAVQIWLQAESIKNAKKNNGKNIIYFSLEMPFADCFSRFISRLAGVNTRNIENASLSKEEFARVKEALDFIKEFPYDFTIVDISDASAQDIDLILTNAEKKYDAVFVDYLGIMQTNDKSDDQDWLNQTRISYELRGISRKYQIPLFSAIQLNRKTPGKTKDQSDNIGLQRLARSAGVATNATHVLQILGDNENMDSYSQLEIAIIKNRKGPKLRGSLIKNLASATLLNPEEFDEIKDEPSEIFSNYNITDIDEEIQDLIL